MAGEDEVTVSAGKPLSRDELKVKLEAKGYPPAMVEGMLRNMLRESGGSTSIMGDHGTSGGLFQHHAERLTEGKAYAKAQGKPWNNADVQIDFADQEMKTKFPELRRELMSETDPARAEDKFKRIFERPASVMWSSNASGGPLLGTDRFRFSDYAMGENSGRRNSSLMYMSPDDYLALSPEFQGDHLNDRSRKSLLSSVNKGDEIDSVPSLDVKVKGPTATVTGQDGRHRAYMAGEEGLDQIPVAINQTGQGSPSEITGMQGNTLPMNFQPADKVSREPSGRGLLGRVMDTIVPSAHAETQPAADDNPFAQFVKQDENPFAQFATPAPAAQPQAAAAPAKPRMGVLDEIGTGMLDPVIGGAQLIGNVVGGGMSLLPGAVGRAGQGLRDYTNRHVAEREAGIAAERGPDAGIDWWRGLGNVAATMPLGMIGGATRLAAASPIVRGAAEGAAGSLFQPTSGEDRFWTDKLEQGLVGAALGGSLGAAGRLAKPKAGSSADKLMREGVELTPGQIAGGTVRRVEDAFESVPITGYAIRAARRRGFEDFNRVAINRGLSDIGQSVPKSLSGHEAIAYAEQQFRNAYDSTIPKMRGALDQGFTQQLTDIVDDAAMKNLKPENLEQLRFTIGQEIVARFNQGGGTIRGPDAQKIGTYLDGEIKRLRRGDIYDQQVAYYLHRADKAMDDMMRRNNPTLQAAKDQIDAGYAKFKTVQAATKNSSDANGLFTPAQLRAAVKARDASRDKAAFARGDALLQDLANDAKDVLQKIVPDSGTPERLMAFGALHGLYDAAGGAGSYLYSPKILATLAAGTLPYMKYTAPVIRNAFKGLPSAAAPAGALAGEAVPEMPTMLVRPNQPAQMQ